MAQIPIPEGAESSTGRVIHGWLDLLGWTGTAERHGADLVFEGTTDKGPLRVVTMSPFLVDGARCPLAEPSLLSFEIGQAPKRPEAWAPIAWKGKLGAIATAEGWLSALLLPGPGPRDVLGSGFGSTLSPLDVSQFLHWIAHLTRADSEQRRSIAWQASQQAIKELFINFPRKRRRPGRPGDMAMAASTGAVIGLYASAVFGSMAFHLLPLTSFVGAICGVGYWGLQQQRRAAITTPEMIAAKNSLVKLGFFESILPVWGADAEWTSGILTNGKTREMLFGSVAVDGRLQAEIPKEGPTVVLTFFRFYRPREANPLLGVLPDSWVLAEVLMPRSQGFAPLGDLGPVPDEGSLGCWMSGQEVTEGKLSELLRPLSIYVPRKTIGPYR